VAANCPSGEAIDRVLCTEACGSQENISSPFFGITSSLLTPSSPRLFPIYEWLLGKLDRKETQRPTLSHVTGV